MKLKARIVWHLEDPIKELVVTDIELSSNDPGELYLQIIILAENNHYYYDQILPQKDGS